MKFFPKIKKTQENIKKESDNYVKVATENITGIREIKSLEERKKIQAEINNKIHKKYSRFTRPSGLVYSRVVVGTNPPLLANTRTPSSRVQTHLFVKGTEPKRRIANPVIKQETPAVISADE